MRISDRSSDGALPVCVDLPALGAPTIATTPQCAVICPVAPALRWRPRSRPPASSRLPPKPVRDPLSPLLPRNGAHDAHPVAEPADIPAAKENGRGSDRERVGQDVEISVVAVSLKKKNKQHTTKK